MFETLLASIAVAVSLLAYRESNGRQPRQRPERIDVVILHVAAAPARRLPPLPGVLELPMECFQVSYGGPDVYPNPN
jgi:hypothetical protein